MKPDTSVVLKSGHFHLLTTTRANLFLKLETSKPKMSLRQQEGNRLLLQCVMGGGRARPCTKYSTVRPVDPAGAPAQSGRTRTTSIRRPPLSLRFCSCLQPRFKRKLFENSQPRYNSIAYCAGESPRKTFASFVRSKTSRSSTNRLSGGCERSSRSARAINRSARVISRLDL